jgi:hypothetical protein
VKQIPAKLASCNTERLVAIRNLSEQCSVSRERKARWVRSRGGNGPGGESVGEGLITLRSLTRASLPRRLPTSLTICSGESDIAGQHRRWRVDPRTLNPRWRERGRGRKTWNGRRNQFVSVSEHRAGNGEF